MDWKSLASFLFISLLFLASVTHASSGVLSDPLDVHILDDDVILTCSNTYCDLPSNQLEFDGQRVILNSDRRFRVPNGKEYKLNTSSEFVVRKAKWDGNAVFYNRDIYLNNLDIFVEQIFHPYEYINLSEKTKGQPASVTARPLTVPGGSCFGSAKLSWNNSNRRIILDHHIVRDIPHDEFAGCIAAYRLVLNNDWNVDGTVVSSRGVINYVSGTTSFRFLTPKTYQAKSPLEVTLFDLESSSSTNVALSNAKFEILDMDTKDRQLHVHVTKGSKANIATTNVNLNVHHKDNCYTYERSDERPSTAGSNDIAIKFLPIRTNNEGCLYPKEVEHCTGECIIEQNEIVYIDIDKQWNITGNVVIRGHLTIRSGAKILARMPDNTPLLTIEGNGRITTSQLTFNILEVSEDLPRELPLVVGEHKIPSNQVTIALELDFTYIYHSKEVSQNEISLLNVEYFKDLTEIDCTNGCEVSHKFYNYILVGANYTIGGPLVIRDSKVAVLATGGLFLKNITESPIITTLDGATVDSADPLNVYYQSYLNNVVVRNVTLIQGDHNVTEVKPIKSQCLMDLKTPSIDYGDLKYLSIDAEPVLNFNCYDCSNGCSVEARVRSISEPDTYMKHVKIEKNGFLYYEVSAPWRNTRRGISVYDQGEFKAKVGEHNMVFEFDQSYLLPRVGTLDIIVVEGKNGYEKAEDATVSFNELAETKCFTITEVDRSLVDQRLVVSIDISLVDGCELSIDRSEPEAYEDVVICDGHNFGNKEESIVRTCTFDEDTDILYGEQLSIGNGETFELNDVEIDSRIGSNIKVIPDLVERIEKSIPVFNVSGEYGKVYLSGKLTIVIDESLLSYFRDSDVKRHSEKLIIVSGNHHVDETLTPSIEMDDKYTSCFNVNVDPSPENNDEEYSLIIQVDSVISESCNSLLIPGDDDDGGLGLGAIIGIAVGGAVLVALVIIIIVVVTIRRSKSKKDVVVPVKSDLKIETSDKIGDDSDSDSESPEYEDETGSGSEETESEESGSD